MKRAELLERLAKKGNPYRDAATGKYTSGGGGGGSGPSIGSSGRSGELHFKVPGKAVDRLINRFGGDPDDQNMRNATINGFTDGMRAGVKGDRSSLADARVDALNDASVSTMLRFEAMRSGYRIGNRYRVNNAKKGG